MDTYKTLRSSQKTEYVVQKSRFIGHAAPVEDADTALRFLDAIRQEHRAASHNCFAYIIGQNKGIIRYSDDGEPSGTAGKPIAEVLLKKDVVDCAVVVTRYFGGILLGAGGLVRAYAHTAAIALDAAGVCTMHETARWRLLVEYPQWDRVSHALRTLPVLVEDTDYTENVTVTLLVRVCDEAKTIGDLTQATDNRIDAQKDEITFFNPWE